MRDVLRNFIREQVNLLFENVQLADKVYFNPGKLSQRVRDAIVSRITNGDNYTKIITDIYWAMLQQSIKTSKWIATWVDDINNDEEIEGDEEAPENDVLDVEKWKELKQYYQDLKEYDKNVFPIKGLDIYNPKDIWNIISGLKQRRSILELFKKLPSIAWRNMKEDIRKERNYPELQDYRSQLEYFIMHYSLLSNRDEDLQRKVSQKIFKAGANLDQLLRFVEDKENLLGGAEFTKKFLKNLVDESYMEIVFESSNIMIIDVMDEEDIKKIGCNSLWCFTYGNTGNSYQNNWYKYSYNGHVYVIVDFSKKTDDSDFMHVLIKPLKSRYTMQDENSEKIPLFNMANEPLSYNSVLPFLNQAVGKGNVKRIFNFVD